ncbi:MAG: gliding motility-associated C-terminal domain-containing protein [Flavobacteriales bacterium]
MKIGLYISAIIIISSCLTTQKTESTSTYVYKPRVNKVLGDTNYKIWVRDCEYVVEDISKKIQFPDSLINREFSQNPIAGDTISSEYRIKIELYFESPTKIDTLFYKVNLRCGASDIPQVIYGCGTQDTWEIPFLKDFPNNTVKVFNRWGNMVFEEKGYYTGWMGTTNLNLTDSDGKTIKNKMLPEGTYFYIINLGEEKLEPMTGYMQIKR